MSRKALIPKGDLQRMAETVAAHGVVFRGRLDALGNLDFTLTPARGGVDSSNDDIDDRLEQFGAS